MDFKPQKVKIAKIIIEQCPQGRLPISQNQQVDIVCSIYSIAGKSSRVILDFPELCITPHANTFLDWLCVSA